MSSFGPSSRGRRLALSVGGALAIALLAAPTAPADFSLAECQGALAPGRGASFQNAAFNGFKGVFAQEPLIGCGSAAGNLLSYDPAGSGAGRRALGERSAPNLSGDRDASIRFGGSDEPPTQIQRQQMETGTVDANAQDVTTADNGKLHVIPVAIGAVAALVNLPTECTSFGTAPLYRQRPKVTLVNFEKAWFAETATWGDLIPGIDAACAALPIKRVVRRDSSGTTFAFKQLIMQINPGRAAWRPLGNQAWPNDTGATAVLRAATDGGSSLATLVRTTPGTIGYVDLATARLSAGAFTYADGQFDRTFWLPMQRTLNDADTYDDPQVAADGYKNGAPQRGANCASVQPRAIPTTPVTDPSLGDWSAVDATLTGTGYAACTLTYNLVFDDNAVVYCRSAQEEAIARTIKDYFTRAVVSIAGQNSLLGSDYDALPGSVLGIAQKAVSELGWNKGGQGRPCPGEPPLVTPTPTPTPNPGTNNPPPPAPPSNAITVASSRVSGTTIRLSLQLPGAGKLSIASSAKPKKGKAITLTTKTVNATKSGAQTVTLSLSTKAKSALRKDKRLKFTVKITFTPTGGTAKTVTRTVTVKQPKR